jgi:hypothetical protein
MKPHLKIVAGRPVTVRTESPALAKARERFGMATGEKSRLFIHEQGSVFQRYPEPCLSRWLRKANFLNVRHSEAA